MFMQCFGTQNPEMAVLLTTCLTPLEVLAWSLPEQGVCEFKQTSARMNFFLICWQFFLFFVFFFLQLVKIILVKSVLTASSYFIKNFLHNNTQLRIKLLFLLFSICQSWFGKCCFLSLLLLLLFFLWWQYFPPVSAVNTWEKLDCLSCQCWQHILLRLWNALYIVWEKNCTKSVYKNTCVKL